ncbi:hypothetical protein [Microbulbifer hainanensis]|uniref:hypothetical protein n=1 Tax=Microbulbifer hainanensis TaxID=2735675 RepID=UPI001867B56E|nr:hypothetical protein [Microbulbifer hainanensis]
MEANIYQPPAAELQSESTTTAREFYVVSKTKFLVLMIATFGIYEIYWFYKNWSLYKRANNEDMWPVPRAIFAIFFAHSLFRLMDSRVREAEKNISWNPEWMGAVYVLATLVSTIADRISTKMPEYSVLDVVSLGLLPLITWVLYRAQSVANLVCGDPEGKSNAQFTAANYAWTVIGVAVWALMGLVLYEAYTGYSA